MLQLQRRLNSRAPGSSISTTTTSRRKPSSQGVYHPPSRHQDTPSTTPHRFGGGTKGTPPGQRQHNPASGEASAFIRERISKHYLAPAYRARVRRTRRVSRRIQRPRTGTAQHPTAGQHAGPVPLRRARWPVSASVGSQQLPPNLPASSAPYRQAPRDHRSTADPSLDSAAR